MSSLSEEEENYIRMSLLLTGLSPRAVRALFDREFPPTYLPSTLNQKYNKLLGLQKSRVINQGQWNLLFPPRSGVADSKTFDVTLMICLIRNLASVTPPAHGFDRLPSTGETTPGADLARIKYYRNYLAHLDDNKIDNSDFTRAWNDISDDSDYSASESEREVESLPSRPHTRGRGRGRGRGLGRVNVGGEKRGGQAQRGRQRGARRKIYGPRPPTRAERAVLLREQRDEMLKDRISQLSQENLNSLVSLMCSQHPTYVLEVVNRLTSQTEMQGYHPPPGSTPPNWCVCGNCREMPTPPEQKCCQQHPVNCFSNLPDFDLLVLEEPVLALHQRYRQDVMAVDADDDIKRGKRHAAYRQFILWQHGYLGAGDRRVISSCCVWKIRDKFPDRFGNYRGFEGGRLG